MWSRIAAQSPVEVSGFRLEVEVLAGVVFISVPRLKKMQETCIVMAVEEAEPDGSYRMSAVEVPTVEHG